MMNEANKKTSNTKREGYNIGTDIPPNTFFSGRIATTLKPNETMKVIPDGRDQALEANFIWVAGMLSHLFGINAAFMPPVGTKVWCYYTGQTPSYIVGCIPDIDVPPVKGHSVASGTESYKTENVFTSQNATKESNRYAGHLPGFDLVEGELDMTNMMGVGIKLLRHFAVLQAGDLAKIECSVIDDFVRFISGNFEHHTPFGEYKIQADGSRMNVIWNGSHLEHESWGLHNSTDDRVPYIPKYEADYKDKDRHVATGRWRFSNYIGYLGNFINMFITEPVKSLGMIAESAMRTGLGRVHVNDDGSILMQTMTEICFERVVRIPTPIQQLTEYDPEGDLTTDEPFPESLRKWDYKNIADMHEAVFQLRDYARWLSNYYTKARFHMLKKDWRVPAETEIPEPLEHGDDEERKKVAGAANYYMDLYACMRITKDGSILLLDGYSNSIHSGKKGVKISAAVDLTIEAAGNVNIVAGHDINMVANKSVSVNALNEGLTLRAKKWFQGICTDNGILLQTDSNNMEDAPDDEDHKVAGITLKATQSRIRLSSLKNIELLTKKHVLVSASNFMLKLKGKFQINTHFMVAAGVLMANTISQIKAVFATQLFGGNVYKSGMGPHPGHVIQKPATIVIGSNDADELSSDPDAADFRHATPAQQRAPQEDIYESLTQQQLKLSPPATLDTIPAATWNLAADCELPGKGSCWPTVGKEQKVYRGAGDDLYIPSPTVEFPNSGSPLDTEPVTYKVVE